jgi:hypothetical protein
VRHWLVVAMMVGQPVAGPVTIVVVRWSPVAATLCADGRVSQRIGRGGQAHLHGNPDGQKNCERVHVGWLQTSVRLNRRALAIGFGERGPRVPRFRVVGPSYPIRHKGRPAALVRSCWRDGISEPASMRYPASLHRILCESGYRWGDSAKPPGASRRGEGRRARGVGALHWPGRHQHGGPHLVFRNATLR